MSCFKKLKCTKFDFGWGSAPDPAGDSQRSPDILAGFKGREGRKDEREKKRRGGEGKGPTSKARREGRGEEEWIGRGAPPPNWDPISLRLCVGYKTQSKKVTVAKSRSRITINTVNERAIFYYNKGFSRIKQGLSPTPILATSYVTWGLCR